MPPVNASVDVSVIRERFNFGWAMSDPIEGLDTWYWWARSIRVDPSEVIADDDQGNLWSIPFSTDGEDEVTFGEPVRVRETFVPVGSGDGVAATAAVTRRRQQVVAAGLQRPSKPTSPTHPQSASTGPTGQEEPDMTDLTTLRAEYGIADDITDDDIADVLRELAPTGADDNPAVNQPPAAENVPATDPVPVPAAASATEAENAALRTTVDRLAAQEDARAEREAATTRESVLASAVREGRISPHERREVWEPFYDANTDAATTQLSKLPANRFPVTEIGDAADADSNDPEAAAFAARRARLTGKEISNA